MSGLAVVRDLELQDTALKETTLEIGGKAQIKRGGQKIHKIFKLPVFLVSFNQIVLNVSLDWTRSPPELF